ncbi:unnamed protein product, partial [Mesorhabditis belari]|uniref:G protein-coupled receptor n=1 Tax=Mesorhabditis belari TaxID=2138241 RepID=A0AAF3F746_9BILA
MSTMNVIYTILCNKLINDLFHGHLSKKTRLQQKKLLTALSIQTAIPLISSGLPWFYYGTIIGIGQTEIKQTLNNIAFAFLGSHGTQSSLALLVLTEPYRVFLLRSLQKIPILKRLATFYLTKRGNVFVVPSTSNNTRTGVQTS